MIVFFGDPEDQDYVFDEKDLDMEDRSKVKRASEPRYGWIRNAKNAQRVSSENSTLQRCTANVGGVLMRLCSSRETKSV
jgi:hypothetical protein